MSELITVWLNGVDFPQETNLPIGSDGNPNPNWDPNNSNAILYPQNLMGFGNLHSEYMLLQVGFTWAYNISARGYVVHLIYLKGPDDLKHQVDGQVKLTNLGRKSRVDWRAIRKLRTYIKVNNITKIWCVNLFSMLYGYMASTNLRNNFQPD